MTLTFSVAIVNYNYGRYLAECLDSVLEQTAGVPQIVVVDDGSTDESAQVLARYADRATVISTANGGQAAAMNVAIPLCTGDIVCLLDADDLLIKSRVAKIGTEYEADPAVQWVFNGLRHIDRATKANIPTPRMFEGRYDQIAAVAAGKKITVPLPATSALSFRREFLSRFLPIPVGMSAPDNYLKFLSVGHAPGFVIGEELSLQGIHDTNVYTTTRGSARNLARAKDAIRMADGFKAFPAMTNFTSGILGAAVALSNGGVSLSPEYRRRLLSHVRALSVSGKSRFATSVVRTTGGSVKGHLGHASK